MHFLCIVVLPKKADYTYASAKTAVEKQMRKRGIKGQYDWYQIGGRWTGWGTDYDPNKDPLNTETCNTCNGTGTRTDGICPGRGNCNGCSGKGERTKWPTSWRDHEGDIGPLKPKIDYLAKIKMQVGAYALFTPGGEWCQDVGEKDLREWQDHWAAVVDMHD